MARSLEGKKFFACNNNGITAIVREDILRSIERRAAIELKLSILYAGMLPQLPQTPVFTFSNSVRAERSPWLTGDRHLLASLRVLIEKEGGTLEGGYFYVPFSNHKEMGTHGKDAQREELKFVTSGQQFADTFGLWPHEVEGAFRPAPSL